MTEADVLITAALADRPARQPDFAAENQALHTLAQQLTDDPPSTLKTLVRIAQDLCRADTAGVSLLETSSDGSSVFRWVAIAGLSLYFRDITDRKQAESALRQSEERYRTLFESIDEGFAVIEVLFDENDKPIDYRFVLVVDDEPDSREFVAFVLKEAGAKVTAVGSASEALQLFSTTPFDILLSDIGMPEMDGYALIREIRKSRDDRGRNLPAIALTAYAGEYEQQEAIVSGFQSHVTKPVNPEKIVTVVARMCGRKREVKT